MRQWLNIKDKQPQITKYPTSDGVLFVCEGKVYSGRYHSNGCFYSDDKKLSAKTTIAVSSGKYSIDQLPSKYVELWMPYPLPPSDNRPSQQGNA